MRVNIIGNNGRYFPSKGENWTLNYQFLRNIKADKIFIMDGIKGLSKVRNKEISRKSVVDLINKMKIPLITPFKEKGVTLSEPYPLKKIKDRYHTLYFKSTIAYMLALAALKECDEIHLYDITCSDHIAYLWERPATEYWLGVLKGQGAKIYIHTPNRLFGGRPSFGGNILYGYEMNENKALKKLKNYGR